MAPKPEPRSLLPSAQQPLSMTRDRRGWQCNVGPHVRRPLRPSLAMEGRSGQGGRSPSRGVLQANTPRTRLLPGMGCHPRASSALHPQASSIKHQAPRPRPPSCASCSLISLLSSSPPSFLAALPSWWTFNPPEPLRSLAFALWPSNSSFSSAAASPQFSAAGSTPSH